MVGRWEGDDAAAFSPRATHAASPRSKTKERQNESLSEIRRAACADVAARAMPAPRAPDTPRIERLTDQWPRVRPRGTKSDGSGRFGSCSDEENWVLKRVDGQYRAVRLRGITSTLGSEAARADPNEVRSRTLMPRRPPHGVAIARAVTNS
jgi:hypothetical protein